MNLSPLNSLTTHQNASFFKENFCNGGDGFHFVSSPTFSFIFFHVGGGGIFMNVSLFEIGYNSQTKFWFEEGGRKRKKKRKRGIN